MRFFISFVVITILISGGYYFYQLPNESNKSERHTGTVIRQDLFQRVKVSGLVSPLRSVSL